MPVYKTNESRLIQFIQNDNNKLIGTIEQSFKYDTKLHEGKMIIDKQNYKDNKRIAILKLKEKIKKLNLKPYGLIISCSVYQEQKPIIKNGSFLNKNGFYHRKINYKNFNKLIA